MIRAEPYYLPSKLEPNATFTPRRIRLVERHRDLDIRWWSRGRWRGPAGRRRPRLTQPH